MSLFKRSNILLIFMILSGLQNLISQTDSVQVGNEVINLNDIEGNAQREEVQRYFGYEDILSRYLTLPYDVSMNTNQQVRFVDIGFVFIVLFPLFLLYYLRNRKVWFWTVKIMLICYIGLCFNSSYIYDGEVGKINFSDKEDIGKYLSQDLTFLECLHSFLFLKLGWIGEHINQLLEVLSPIHGYITYPIYLLIFIVLIAGTLYSERINKKSKFLLLLFLSYSVMWAISAGGIIWYGFLMLPLGFLLILISISKIGDSGSGRFLKKVSLSVLVIWLFLSLTARLSNINIANAGVTENMGKSIVDANMFYYTMGLSNAQQVMDNSFSNLSPALARINNSDQLIYQIGTAFTYDIKHNYKRTIQDNLLTNFYQLYSKYRNPQDIIAALEASNVKFVIVDLNTYTLDKTPERTLENKYKLLLQTLYKNPLVALISTDRLVEVVKNNGERQEIYNVFGSKIIRHGSFAIYEIL